MKILLADDERELRQALIAILTHAGYEVTGAADGEEALYEAQCHAFDLIILDIMMPKMDGLTVLRKLREDAMDVPVLMLTARADIDDRVVGLDAGANDYLVKPFAAKELLARIRAITHTSPGAVKTHPAFGDIELDEGNSEISCQGKSCALTANELKIMKLLLSHGGGLTSMEAIRREVWGLLSDTEPSVIWVNISNLRKKLKSTGAEVQIAAVRGLGYRLEMPEGK
ncbi:MAG: response regulator transcription factor [Atopobiaceae bacterium]